jgi:hypothetical protein
MAKIYDGQDASFKAYDDMSSSQYLFVKATSTKDTVDVCAATTDIPIGVLQEEGETGYGVGVRLFGHTKIILGEVVAAGDVLGTNASGQAVAVVDGTDTTAHRVGICTAGGNTSEVGEMVFIPGGRAA